MLFEMRKSLFVICIILAILISLVIVFNRRSAEKKIEINSDEIELSIHLAADYLQNSVQDNGMFTYRINTIPEIKLKPKYNIVRHAGTVYSFCEYYRSYPNKKTLNSIQKTGAYLIEQAISAIPQYDSLYAVWSKPEINNSGDPLQAKLGATGLGLAALANFEQIKPESTPLSTLQALGNFIIFMQKNDGSFYSKYFPDSNLKDDKWISLYYPGEAALGLLLLYEIDADKKWLQAAEKALYYLAETRKGKKSVPDDHWALIATQKLFNLSEEKSFEIKREVLIEHAMQICENILEDQILNKDIPFYGGFSPEGKLTHTSTRLEGLLAAAKFLLAETALKKRIENSIKLAIKFLVDHQVNSGEFTGGFTRAILYKDADHPQARAFNTRVTEIRIDYVQHALCAMLEYLKHNSDTNNFFDKNSSSIS